MSDIYLIKDVIGKYPVLKPFYDDGSMSNLKGTSVYEVLSKMLALLPCKEELNVLLGKGIFPRLDALIDIIEPETFVSDVGCGVKLQGLHRLNPEVRIFFTMLLDKVLNSKVQGIRTVGDILDFTNGYSVGVFSDDLDIEKKKQILRMTYKTALYTELVCLHTHRIDVGIEKELFKYDFIKRVNNNAIHRFLIDVMGFKDADAVKFMMLGVTMLDFDTIYTKFDVFQLLLEGFDIIGNDFYFKMIELFPEKVVELFNKYKEEVLCDMCYKNGLNYILRYIKIIDNIEFRLVDGEIKLVQF